MNTIELKNILISKITQIDDQEFLKALNTIIENKVTTNYTALEEYNHELYKAEEDINIGNVYSQEEIKQKVEAWKKR
jgi:F0F1-type ATP synthase delta subunit